MSRPADWTAKATSAFGPALSVAIFVACGAAPDDTVASGSAATSEPSNTSSQDGETTPGTGDSSTDCTYPPHADALELDVDAAIEVPDVVSHSAGTDKFVLTCGATFLAASNPVDGTSATLGLEDACAGMVALDDERVAVATATNLSLVAIAADGTLAVTDSVALASPAFGLAADDERLMVASGTNGVISYAVDGDSIGVVGELPGASDARDLVAAGEAWLVADGDAGTRLLDDSGSLGKITLEGTTDRAFVEGTLGVVGRGPLGFAILDLADNEVALVEEVKPDGRVTDASLAADQLVVTTLNAIVRYDLAGAAAMPISWQERPWDGLISTWYTGLAKVGDQTFVAAGSSLIPLHLGDPAPAPHVRATHRTLSFWVDEGDTSAASVLFANRGGEDLVVGDLSVTPPFSVAWSDLIELDPRPGCSGQYVVPPDQLFMMDVTYTASDSETKVGELSVVTSDPDAPVFAYRIEVNRPQIAPGDPAPDFLLHALDTSMYRLSDQLGDVVLIKAFDDS